MTGVRTRRRCCDLEISPNDRKKVLRELKLVNYAEGPLPDKLNSGTDMWVFGKMVKGKEIYIKITMGTENAQTICISFHIAEHKITYPFKDNEKG